MKLANKTHHSVGLLVSRMLSRLVDLLQSHWKLVVVGLPFVWLLLFFLAPFIIELILVWYCIAILDYWNPGIVLALHCLKKTSIVHAFLYYF